jgi:hypothetical protein
MIKREYQISITRSADIPVLSKHQIGAGSGYFRAQCNLESCYGQEYPRSGRSGFVCYGN